MASQGLRRRVVADSCYEGYFSHEAAAAAASASSGEDSLSCPGQLAGST